MLFQFLQLQFQQPSKGDWASTCQKDLKDLEICQSLEEIKSMTKTKFRNLIKVKIKEKAFNYLIEKRGQKGKEINYFNLKMANYLLPNNQGLKIEEQQQLFAIRNRMIDISTNFPNKSEKESFCMCGLPEDMKHIYTCKSLNSGKITDEYENIFSEDLTKQSKVYRRFQQNIEKREKMKN